MRVLFVCTGNTCRSPMAEGILRDLAIRRGVNIEVSSAGISTFDGGLPAQNSVKAMEDIGIDINGHRTTMVDENLLNNQDLILTMSKSHKDIIISNFPGSEDKIYTLLEFAEGREEDIADPFGGDYNIYKSTRDEIKLAIEKSWRRIEND